MLFIVINKMKSATIIFLGVLTLFQVTAAKKAGLSILEAKHAQMRPKGRIIGGEKVIPHSIPYQAALFINDDLFCGGVLISPNYVLTTASCLESAERVEVVLGAHNLFEEEKTQVIIYGEEKILPEDYNESTFHNDIGLIKLAQPAPINNVIQSATLPPVTDLRESYLGEIATATGWGLTEDVPNPSQEYMSDALLKVDLLIMNLTVCLDLYDEPAYTTFVCTSGDQNKGICLGDGGGPLLLDGVVIGISSFGYTQCGSPNPSVYTKVVSYLDWIVSNSDVKISL